MLRIAKALATSGLLAFTGALFTAATATPAVTCNIELLIDPYGTYYWQCYGACPAPPTETCSLTGMPWDGGWMIFCACPVSSRLSICPGGLLATDTGLLIPKCLLPGDKCSPAHVCKVNGHYSSQYFSDTCRCEPTE